MIELMLIIAAIVIVMDLFVLWLYVAPALARLRAERALSAHCAATGVLCLTYDDGPGRTLTPALVELLSKHNARATFFLLGRRAQAAPDVASAVKVKGHDIGCHSCNHLNAWKAPFRSCADVQSGYDTLAPWLPSGALFRPPHGKLTGLTQRIARRHGSAIAWWTIDSGDTWDELPDVSTVVEKVNDASGGVILMHDFDREDDDASERAAFVLELTERLLDLAKRRNWRILTLTQLMRELESSPDNVGAKRRDLTAATSASASIAAPH